MFSLGGTPTLRAARLSPAHRILIPPPSPRSIPSPHDGEVGRGSGRGDFKRARQFDGTSPSPQPSPLVPRRERGHFSDGGVYQDAPWADRRPLGYWPARWVTNAIPWPGRRSYSY